MKISAKSRYALYLMLALAMQEEGVNLSVKSVAEQRGISEKYLEQIIPLLVRGDLVRSVRGAKGGYHLTRDPEDCTVGTCGPWRAVSRRSPAWTTRSISAPSARSA